MRAAENFDQISVLFFRSMMLKARFIVFRAFSRV